MNYTSALIGAVALACIAAPAAVAASDAALLQQLESAATDNEYRIAVKAVYERVEQGPLDAAHSDRIMTALADGLAGERVLQYQTASYVSAALRTAGRPLPDTAFDALLAALEHPAMLNRWGASDVLGALAVDDRRRSRAINALSSVVVDHEHEHTRSSAAEALSDLGLGEPLPEPAIAVLVDAALTDDYVTVRIDAADALSHQALERERAIAVTESLTAELINPTEVTRRARGLASFRSHAGRAGELLERMYDPPYPEHVIDLWINLTIGTGYRAALDKLRPAVLRDELTPAQHEALLNVARRVGSPPHSIDIYATAFAGTTPGDVARAVQALSSTDTPEAQLAAAYRIFIYYQADGVPEDIADIAASRLGSAVDAGLFQALVRLIASSAEHEARQDRLVAGLIARADEREAYRKALPLLPLTSLEQIVLQTAAAPQRPPEFRSSVLGEFARRADDTATLSPDLEETLQEAARTSGDYAVSQSAGRALDAWGGNVPLRVKLENRQNQSAAMGHGFFALLVVNGLAGIVGLVSILAMPLRTASGTSTGLKRTAFVSGWLALSAGMFVVAGIAFIGFLGHNSAPPPSWTLSLNTPLYVATPVYLLLAWLALKRARRPAEPVRAPDAGDAGAATTPE